MPESRLVRKRAAAAPTRDVGVTGAAAKAPVAVSADGPRALDPDRAPGATAAAVLTLNAGSSSIKFSLFDVDKSDHLSLGSRGEVEGLGTAPHFVARDPAGAVLADRRWPDPREDFQ